ncbi:GspH/FimT family pseudopilin [Aromatoleum anaerobium]|uniref:GspH/FimT family pseudopilin n=1 Tax=Aromatoleum anaerobium TaxID=182180 RepID=UPI001B7CDC75|nr:GspH/FimT family pseudopilin [Aromatoleum anaerobium]MCK0506284.1 GspH/FimT family pseudopilin [Aromatoleum anaerobium]
MASAHLNARYPVRGFTLIELMVAIAILGIVLGLGMPAFNSAIQNNRATSATNDLVTALQLARSEAVKRRQDIVVCRRNGDGDACANGTDWAVGWLVQGPQEQDDGTVVQITIQVWDPPHGRAILTGPNAGITFQQNGQASREVDFSVVFKDCSGNEKRTINVKTTGRVSTTRTACP